MYNKYKDLFRRIRERLGEERCEELSRKLQPGMLTYLDDGTEIDPQIVSLKDTPKKEVSENDIAEAIRTISYGMGIPVGEIVLSLKRLQRDRKTEVIRKISSATRFSASEVEHFLIPQMEKAANGMNSMAQSFADATKMLQAATSGYKNADDIIQNFGKDLGRGAEYVLTKDMAERLKEQFGNPTKVYFSKEPIEIGPCSDVVLDAKPVFEDSSSPKSFTAKAIFSPSDLYKGIIVYQGDSYMRRSELEYRQKELNRHTSRHIPFYFKIFGQSRFVPRKNGSKDHTKFNRNVRPKGTHSHFKFYR